MLALYNIMSLKYFDHSLLDAIFGIKQRDTPKEKSEAEIALETSQSVYTNGCRKLGLIPSSKILRQFAQQDMNMKGQGLGSKGVKTICIALLVSSE